jgi:hypothetical protein
MRDSFEEIQACAQRTRHVVLRRYFKVVVSAFARGVRRLIVRPSNGALYSRHGRAFEFRDD